MIFGKIVEGLGKVFGFVDELHTSGEEKLQLKQELLSVQAGIITEAIQLERASLEAKSRIIEAEAKSEGWLTRSWRPLTALSFAAIVVYAFITGTEIPEPMWTTLNIMIGGYVGSRGAEKLIPKVAAALKAEEKA